MLVGRLWNGCGTVLRRRDHKEQTGLPEVTRKHSQMPSVQFRNSATHYGCAQPIVGLLLPPKVTDGSWVERFGVSFRLTCNLWKRVRIPHGHAAVIGDEPRDATVARSFGARWEGAGSRMIRKSEDRAGGSLQKYFFVK